MSRHLTVRLKTFYQQKQKQLSIITESGVQELIEPTMAKMSNIRFHGKYHTLTNNFWIDIAFLSGIQNCSSASFGDLPKLNAFLGLKLEKHLALYL